MSDRELLLLFRRISRDIDARQRAQIQRLRGIERDLFEAIVTRLVDELTTSGGRITSTKGEAKISEAIDKVFEALERGQFREFSKHSLSDFRSIFSGTSLYYKGLYESTSKGSKFNAIKRRVNATMRKRLGLRPDGTIDPAGSLARIFPTEFISARVKEVVMSGVTGKITPKQLMRALEVEIKGTRDRLGIVEANVQGFVLDTYQQFDRATNDQFAKRLTLTDFVYEGGLIETSRVFCEKHNGKVFSIEEANRDWPNDPSLPRTTKEKETGILIDYVPTEDMGRWNCRHRTRYVSKQMAERLRV